MDCLRSGYLKFTNTNAFHPVTISLFNFCYTYTMKIIIPIFLLLSLSACQQSVQTSDVTNNDSIAIVSDTSNKLSEQPSRQLQITAINYDNWDEFWKNFTETAAKKDNHRLLGFINFPFLQEAQKVTADEFAELFISQLDGIENADVPVDANGLPLQGVDKDFPRLDSIKYTNFNEKDFYFAKVKGYYKLVEIITPG